MKILLYQMFRSIMYIHGLNICHRDIKPHNFVFHETGELFVIDLGSIKFIENEDFKST